MSSDRTIQRVLLCVADQWRGDAIGALGTVGVETPHFDALAADGVLFANHFCQASPCGPSRRSMLTGTGPSTNGQWTNDTTSGQPSSGQELPTLASVLADAGVVPMLVGYTDTPQASANEGTPSAFDDPERWPELVDPAYEVVRPFIWQHGFPNWQAALASAGVVIDADHPFGLFAPTGRPDETGLAPASYPADLSDSAFVTDGALEAIDAWDGRGLLSVNWLRPHPPMTASRPYHRLVNPGEVEVPVRVGTIADQAHHHPYFEQTVPGRSITEYVQERRRVETVGERDDRFVRAAYYGLVAEVDAQFGRLVSRLRERGLYDSTLIIVTSDHGDALGEHWIYGRRGPFDGHFRVPCIVRDPRPSADRTRGETVTDLTAGVDLVPTILDALSIAAPPSIEGRSLVPHLNKTGPQDWRCHVRYDMSYADHVPRPLDRQAVLDHRFAVVKTDRHRLVRFEQLPPLLYDLVEDPAETFDRSTDPTKRSVLTELLALAE